ncbi:restriction endonuclease subunit S [Sutterella sp.]|uniref:restriction endonuclease subunit S n=1 Tax=Sutterella sp. TaxID=1981025 RepID=UPI0026DFC761|nr:restriction endonuclease subunit S [Sutterella sp.]MDO5530983.1 restriction endonuclease subunit S [Sutterella sp.]
MNLKAVTADEYWRELSARTRIEPPALLMITAAAMAEPGQGGGGRVSLRGTESLRRFVTERCPWLGRLTWNIAVPPEPIEIELPEAVLLDPRALAESYFRLFRRSFTRRAEIRDELARVAVDWLVRDDPQDDPCSGVWVAGESRAFLLAVRLLLEGRSVRLATPSVMLAQLFLALRAFSFNAEARVLEPGEGALARLDGPVFSVPEPNTEEEAPRLGKYSLDELNYAEAAAECPGRLAVLVSGGMLYRTLGDDVAVKRRLLESGRVRFSIAFPIGAGAASGVETFGLLLCGERGDERPGVTLIDFVKPEGGRTGRGGWPADAAEALDGLLAGRETALLDHAAVPVPRLLERQCALTVGEYLQAPGDDGIDALLKERGSRPLSAFCEVIRCHSLGARASSGAGAVFEAMPNDLTLAGDLRQPAKRIDIEPGDTNAERRLKKQILQPGDLLITQRGRIGQVGIVREIPEGECWAAGQLFLVLRLRAGGPVGSPEYLMKYLLSDAVQKRLKRFTSNTSVPQLRAGQLESFPLPLPDPESGTAAAERSVERIRALAAEVEDLQERLRQEMQSLTV